MEMEQRVHPRLAPVLHLRCQIVPAFGGGLHKEMLADVFRHLLAQQGQRLLVHPVAGAPAHQCRQRLFTGGKQLCKLGAETVFQHLEE